MFDFDFLKQGNRLHQFWPDFLKHQKFSILDRQGSHELLYYKSSAKKYSRPIFIIPSMISHYYILDLQEDKSLINYLNQNGHDVYVLNWGLPTTDDQFMDFNSLLLNRIPYFIEQVLKHSKQEDLNLMGHCLGGTIAAMYASLNKKEIKSLFLLTAPLDFSINSKLSEWINTGTVNYKMLIDSFGNIPWPVLHSSFLMLKPLSQYSRLKKYFQTKMTDEQKRNYWSLELWSHDSVAFRGGCYMNLIYDLYMKNSFSRGTFQLSNYEFADLNNIKTPTLLIASDSDHIVPLESAFLNSNYLRHAQVTRYQYSGGHVSCLVHKKTQMDLWPKINQWIGSQNDNN
ncbi:MAG: alpha/beta fold hydrolase [Pseudobdellovibrio sp.]